MTKIDNVKDSFSKIEPFLLEHDISLIFFNNKSYFITTKIDYEFSQTHKYIFEHLQNVKCSSITDFSELLLPLRNIEMMFPKDIYENNFIILSDGFHTADESNNSTLSLNEIKDYLKNKFTYSIGLGNDFDSNLLDHISISKKNNLEEGRIFDFLFNDNNRNPFYYKIKPKSFFITDNLVTIVDKKNNFDTKNIINIDDNIDSNYSIEYKEKAEYYRININKGAKAKAKTKPKHYLFAIDISGSMDDLFSRTTKKSSSQIHYFYTKKCINIALENNSSIFYISKSNFQPDQKTIEEWIEQDFSEYSDELFYTCVCLYFVINLPHNRIQLLHKLLKKSFKDDFIKNFVEGQYDDILTIGEKRMNAFLNTKINDIFEIVSPPSPEVFEKDNIMNCCICYSKKKRIIFNCGHFCICFKCSVRLLEESNNNLNISTCPICRETVKYIRKVTFPDKIQCIRCKINLANVYQESCTHALYCSTCVDTNKNLCEMCNSTIDVYKSFRIS